VAARRIRVFVYGGLTRPWLRVYDRERPHDSLGLVPPLTFLPTPTNVGQPPWELSA